MNYLGHLLVLPDEGLVTLGNLLGDFFKGPARDVSPVELGLGVRLHREIDRYTDQHPAVVRSVERLGPAHRRIAGVLVDVFYDHFLAQDADIDALRAAVEPHVGGLPDALRPIPLRMITGNWMGSYRRVEGIGEVLVRMEQRHKKPLGLAGAEQLLRLHYKQLEDDLAAFYPDVMRFTKEALHRLRSACPAEAPPDAATGSASDPRHSA